jgi:predicted nucleic acid-binding protein
MLPALTPILAYTRDPKDDKFVACAIAGQVEYLITLDQDILVLKTLADVTMVTPHDFIEQRGKNAS